MAARSNLQDLYHDLETAFALTEASVFLWYRRAIVALACLKSFCGLSVLPATLLWLWQGGGFYSAVLETALAGFAGSILLGMHVSGRAEKACRACLPERCRS